MAKIFWGTCLISISVTKTDNKWPFVLTKTTTSIVLCPRWAVIKFDLAKIQLWLFILLGTIHILATFRDVEVAKQKR